jgi:signal transduction histidine kinase
MLASVLLFLDFILLGIVFFFYFRRAMRERKRLQGVAKQSVQLQQKIYQIQVLQEIGERIGYSLDTNKITEIITNSIGALLEYDTVSFMLFPEHGGDVIYKVHVHNSVPHQFLEDVKQKIVQATSLICGQEINNLDKLDERMTGTILDDHLTAQLESYINVPIIISEKLLGMINIASMKKFAYGVEEAGALYDITNQAATAVTKLENVLENEKGRLAGILYSMTDGVMMVDLQNQLQVYNPAVVDLLRLPVGKDITMFDIVDSLAGKVDLRTKIDEAIEKHMPITVPEVLLPDKALELTITPVRDRQGGNRGASVILHDVTSEKALEKLRQEFTAMMVHELRAPLTAVRWSSESLLKSLGDGKSGAEEAEKIKQGIATIDAATINMLELVNDLLDVAKIEAGKFDLNIQEYDLVEIVQAQVTTFQAQAELKHLSLALIAPPHCRIKCDKVRISQVVDNLLSNAIKYTDSGKIDVNISVDAEDKKQAVVAIKDSGIGVTREDLNQLFSKFKQLASSDRSRKGTGLGLVVSKGIVEAHKGQIWAESAGENMGSTFYFSLPL